MSEWWRDAVVYQVYIRSFADSDGDGEGDIAGIRSRLPYLKDLGVDAIWITPWYPSPMVDGGYDVADYRAVDPRYGGLDDARALIEDAHGAGLRLMIDIVPNHTSAAHPWFREAIAAPRRSAARARYFFRDGHGPAGEQAPNNWRSVFGGPAWAPAPDDGRSPRQWYLHVFDESQPDLNWDNPEVRTDFETTLRFWLSLGVDGFRIDVASFLLKAPGLPDLPDRSEAIARADDQATWDAAAHPYENQPGLHMLYRRWRAIVDSAGRDVAFCGEIHLPAPGIASFLGPNELHTAFNFDFALRPWDAASLRTSIDATLATHAAVGAPPTWVIGNHDLPRPTYRYGRLRAGDRWNAWERIGPADRALGLRRARAAALLYLALPGSAYLYQGDELGLPEVLDLPPEARQDPTFRRSGGSDVGRDGTRVPIPWRGERPPFGFGPDGSRPWLPQPAAWSELSVEAESADPASTLQLYRTALLIRRSHPGLAARDFRWLASPDRTIEFGRADRFVCAVNLSSRPIPLPPGRVLLASAPLTDDGLEPDATAWLELDREGDR
jgi:alpha-glucosidase